MIKQLEDTANAYLSVLAEGELGWGGINKQHRHHTSNPTFTHCLPPHLPTLLFPHPPSFPLSLPPLGGIQLSLQSEKGTANDENNSDTSYSSSDKIIKSVWVRHHGEAGGEGGGFRERGLSQLSGGQWRRVSMALDFAFAEVID